MIIFVNNRPFCISENPKIADSYTQIFDVKKNKAEKLVFVGNILIKNANAGFIFEVISKSQVKDLGKLAKVTFWVENKEKIKKSVKSKIPLIKAAGGVVENHKNEILMMKRLGHWDLPKGKADPGENSATTAQREVEEECNVQVFVKEKVCTTWHTYFLKEKLVLKRTKWYRMVLITDKKMKPQKEEGIEELRWMDRNAVEQSMAESYKTIEYVVSKYYGQHLIFGNH
ncbi:MAG: NUDIX domain-containing protein [Cytophagaceae bacterium]|nr:NUDIX domain-containing protein [Cytophagaceae bacterium]MBL0326180.1 NUDIX domain-containing protein [Cytophagaceae bacterium]